MSTAHKHDAELLAVGQQCSAPLCSLVDFLPFKCQHCNQPFCGDHFRPSQHSCEHYDETKHNRIAPPCPFCNTPVAIPPGQDPNIRMENHFASECSVMTGRTVESSTPRCANARCKKVLFAPIGCGTCKQQFCPQHRFPKDHVCVAVNVKVGSSSTSRGTSAAASAAMAAMKRAANNANAATTRATTTKPKPKPTSFPSPKNAPPNATLGPSSSSASSSRSNPFSKTDRIFTALVPSRLDRGNSLSTTKSTPPVTNAPSPTEPTLPATNPSAPAVNSNRCTPKSTLNPRSFAPPPVFVFS